MMALSHRFGAFPPRREERVESATPPHMPASAWIGAAAVHAVAAGALLFLAAAPPDRIDVIPVEIVIAGPAAPPAIEAIDRAEELPLPVQPPPAAPAEMAPPDDPPSPMVEVPPPEDVAPVRVEAPAPAPVVAPAVRKAPPPARPVVKPVMRASPAPVTIETLETQISAAPAPTETPASPPPQAAAAPARASVEFDYIGRLMAWLERHKSYPRHARLRRIEGRVIVHIRLAPSGAVLEAKIAEGSGQWLLDDAALEMIRKADPVPAPPPDASLEFSLPVVFSVQGGKEAGR